jgi:hypothetical protein
MSKRADRDLLVDALHGYGLGGLPGSKQITRNRKADGLMQDAKIVLLVLFAAWLLHHGHHYRRNRRAGCGVWLSMRGPWGTRVRVSKRL